MAPPHFMFRNSRADRVFQRVLLALFPGSRTSTGTRRSGPSRAKHGASVADGISAEYGPAPCPCPRGGRGRTSALPRHGSNSSKERVDEGGNCRPFREHDQRRKKNHREEDRSQPPLLSNFHEDPEFTEHRKHRDSWRLPCLILARRRFSSGPALEPIEILGVVDEIPPCSAECLLRGPVIRSHHVNPSAKQGFQPGCHCFTEGSHGHRPVRSHGAWPCRRNCSLLCTVRVARSSAPSIAAGASPAACVTLRWPRGANRTLTRQRKTVPRERFPNSSGSRLTSSITAANRPMVNRIMRSACSRTVSAIPEFLPRIRTRIETPHASRPLASLGRPPLDTPRLDRQRPRKAPTRSAAIDLSSRERVITRRVHSPRPLPQADCSSLRAARELPYRRR